MPRTIAVRVGYTVPPAPLGGGADDLSGIGDSVSRVLARARSQSDGIGITDSASSNIVSGLFPSSTTFPSATTYPGG